MSIVFIVIVILLIIFIVWTNKNHYREWRAHKTLQQSTGAYDDYARRALIQLCEIKPLSPIGHFTKGNIIHRNYLTDERNYLTEAETRQLLDQVAHDYTIAIQTNNDHNQFMLDQVVDFFEHNPRTVTLTTRPVIQEAQQSIIDDRASRIQDNNSQLGNALQYLDDAVAHTSDPQNVHDNAVVAESKHIIMSIWDPAVDKERCLQEIHHHIPDQHKHNIHKVLNLARQGHTISSYGRTPDGILPTELDIMVQIWARTNAAINHNNAPELRAAFYESLNSCIENDEPVCINGRCARYIDTLTLLDAEQHQGLVTKQTYKNQIFEDSAKIILTVLYEAKHGSDIELQTAATSYESGKADESPSNTQLQNIMKDRIKNNVATYSAFTDAEKERICAECFAGI